ncbi:MAG: transcriptional regulator, partial [Paludibacteraceae bacterium]|nr:transcriptional regulator [Paludibacteraceae bacterium]
DYRNVRDFTMALKMNDERLKSAPQNTQKYALIAFLRSLTYKESGDVQMQQYWLLKSAIADLQLGITDNASSWELANIRYKMSDIKRAHQYINYSVNNSTIFNARLRFTQIAEVQSIINKAYLTNKAQQEKKMRILLIFISLLTLLLLTSVIGIFLQNRKISKANAETIKANNELNRLNWELNRINDEIKNTNADLSESNQVKEEYIGHFLSLCSLYIDKMDIYRKSVRKKLLNGQQNDVIEDIKSSEFMDNELMEFYKNFDQSFLRLYPDFVYEFNNLLLDEEKIGLKKDELLNTELRIFALIRLGIDNSAKIAELLHYSANTIYNYRAKIKNKAKVSRNDFESRVKKIGTFTK